MPGPPPKDPKLRQRRNKTTTAATLVISNEDGAKKDAVLKVDLPVRPSNELPWHSETQTFWKEVWASPMAAEYLAADVPGLVLLARLIDRFNYGDTSLAAEIRLQRQCFGLTPLDRRRLQWEIERGESAERRRKPSSPAQAPTGARDPRRTLRAVK